MKAGVLAIAGGYQAKSVTTWTLLVCFPINKKKTQSFISMNMATNQNDQISNSFYFMTLFTLETSRQCSSGAMLRTPDFLRPH